MKQTSAIQDIIGAIRQTLDATGRAPRSQYVAFDVDGTLWRDDLGEIGFARGYQEGLIQEKYVEDVFWKWAKRHGLDRREGFDNAIMRIIKEDITQFLACHFELITKCRVLHMLIEAWTLFHPEW